MVPGHMLSTDYIAEQACFVKTYSTIIDFKKTFNWSEATCQSGQDLPRVWSGRQGKGRPITDLVL